MDLPIAALRKRFARVSARGVSPEPGWSVLTGRKVTGGNFKLLRFDHMEIPYNLPVSMHADTSIVHPVIPCSAEKTRTLGNVPYPRYR